MTAARKRGELVECRVLEHRQVALDDRTYAAGETLRLPAADVDALEKQGFVERVGRRGAKGQPEA